MRTILGYIKKLVMINIITLLLVILLCCPSSIYATICKSKNSVVKFKEGLISTDAKDADMYDLINIIQDCAGVNISIYDKDIKSRKVSLQIENADLETVLKLILKTNYAFVFVKDPSMSGRYVLGIFRGHNTI